MPRSYIPLYYSKRVFLSSLDRKAQNTFRFHACSALEVILFPLLKHNLRKTNQFYLRVSSHVASADLE